MDAKELKKYTIDDKAKALEIQKETVESFKQFFGDYEIVFETVEELENKFNDFIQWKNNEWIVPGTNKTPKQLLMGEKRLELNIKRVDLKNKFPKKAKKLGLIADPIFGIVMFPFYGYLKDFFNGNYKSIPDYEGFFDNVIISDSFIPSFVIKNIILKNKENAIKIFKKFYNGVRNLDDVSYILEKNREDWNDASAIWQNLVDLDGTEEENKYISEEQSEDFENCVKEFDIGWEEYFKEKEQPKNDEEDRKQQEDFYYWYNNVRKQNDTGKTPIEMGKRIVKFNWDKDINKPKNWLEEEGIEKPFEVSLIEKILTLVSLYFKDEVARAFGKYKLFYSDKNKKLSKLDLSRDFQAWFLLEHKLPNGKTPVEFVFCREDIDKLFSKKEKNMIGNFLAFKKTLFEIKYISRNRKDYLIQDVLDDRKYLVKTIDFPSKLIIGDFINALIIKRLDDNYFFYGLVTSFSRENGLEIKKDFLKKYEELKSKQNYE